MKLLLSYVLDIIGLSILIVVLGPLVALAVYAIAAGAALFVEARAERE